MNAVSGLSDITPLTLLDYTGKVACIFWFSSCNLRCRYCYNTRLVQGRAGKTEGRDERDALEFLRRRAGFLEGVVLSGGECTLYPGLLSLAASIRELGYRIKLDTNGTRPEVVREMAERGLVDYIALDYKAGEDSFGRVTGRPELFASFSRTLDYLTGREFLFEVRTTVHPDLTGEDEVSRINEDLYRRGYRGTHYIQHYFQTESTLGGLTEPVRRFDPSRVCGRVPVEWRNFPEC